MKRFEVIHRIPSPYRVHLFTEMWRQLTKIGIEFHVNFASDMSRGYDERPKSWRNPKMEFPYTYWRDYGWKHYQLNPGLIAHVRKLRPDWLWVGSPYDNFTSILATLFCPAQTRITYAEGNTKTPGILTGFVGWFKRYIYSKYSFVTVPGCDAVRYMSLHQSLTKRKLADPVILPNLIDESMFRPKAAWDCDEIESMRKLFGVRKDERFAVTPARLEECKGLREYISSLNPEMIRGWKIAILGQGRLKDELNTLIHVRGLGDKIKLYDFISYSDMPKLYASADLFILPSMRDPNPLSVVEALSSALPVAVSDQAGNVEEGVTEGRNGWRLPVLDKRRYVEKLQEIFATELSVLQQMGEVSYNENAQFWNTSKAVASFLRQIGVN